MHKISILIINGDLTNSYGHLVTVKVKADGADAGNCNKRMSRKCMLITDYDSENGSKNPRSETDI